MIRLEEQNEVLGDFTRRLEKIRIEYMLTGSMAMVHYAMPRTTVDIDLVIKILPANLDQFIAEFAADYYIPLNSAKDAVRRKKMFNVLNQETVFKVDCVILKDDEFAINAFSRRKKVDYSGDFDVWIISKEDLILSKLNWAKNTKSERQMMDVASIIRNGFNEAYVEKWAKKLDVEELLRECFELLNKNYVDGHDS